MPQSRKALTITPGNNPESGTIKGKVDRKAKEIGIVLKKPMKKTCTKCKKEKNETDFPLTRVRGRMLRRSWCDACMKIYYKKYRLSKLNGNKEATERNSTHAKTKSLDVRP